MKIHLIKLIFTAFIAFMTISVNAFQLGKITVNSKQEQPLNADIEVIITKTDDLTKMVPSIASKEDFESQGIERLPVHSNIDANFVKNSEGKTYLKLKSSNPVKDPFLDLLIQIDSESGRNYREYTVLLDPADPMDKIINENLEKDKEAKEASKEPAKKLAEGKSVEIEKKPIKLEEKNPKQVEEQEIKQEPVKAEKKELKDEKVNTVKSTPGKTLYQIGRENSLSGITLEQMVVAIFLNNKKAFAEENLNGLNKNQVLTIPNKEFFDDFSHLEARKILKEQNGLWKKLSQSADKPKVEAKLADKPKVEAISVDKAKIDAENEKIKNLERKLAEAERKLQTVTEKKLDSEESLNIEDKQDILEFEDIGFSKDMEENDDVFTSSITPNDEIKETIISDNEKKQDNLLIVLVLLFVIVLIAGIAFILSKKRKSSSESLFSNNVTNDSDNDVINEFGNSNINDENKTNF